MIFDVPIQLLKENMNTYIISGFSNFFVRAYVISNINYFQAPYFFVKIGLLNVKNMYSKRNILRRFFIQLLVFY